MRLDRYQCDVCSKEINENAFSFEIQEEGDRAIFHYSTNPKVYTNHACGAECLTNALNKSIQKRQKND